MLERSGSSRICSSRSGSGFGSAEPNFSRSGCTVIKKVDPAHPYFNGSRSWIRDGYPTKRNE
uniref:Uncharacterized protein n=1 Tax=Romanomermis culicivorax TaxID=13658 RepID=A0A915HGU6_ROMCU